MQKLKELIAAKKREQELAGKTKHIDSPYVPSSDQAATQFITLAKLTKDDIVVDLGCGNGKVLIEAAKQIGCKCIGIEIDETLVNKTKENVKQLKLDHLIEVVQCDFKSQQCFEILQQCTVVFIFLLPKV